MTELARRYVVMPLATPAPFDPADPDGVFVLKPWKDPAALRALRAYRDSCFPELRRDLDAWIRAIEAGPAVRGDIGRRNEPFARTAVEAGAPERDAPPVARMAAGARAATKVEGKRAARPSTGAKVAARAKRASAVKAKPSAAQRRAPKKPARKRR
jgi:hypothetical protein